MHGYDDAVTSSIIKARVEQVYKKMPISRSKGWKCAARDDSAAGARSKRQKARARHRPSGNRNLSLSLGPIALSLRPSAARSSSSCKVKVTSDVLCYNRWGALRQVQCLVESGRDTWSPTLAAFASTQDCAPVTYEQ